MKLRNKKTGVVVEINGVAIHNSPFDLYDKHNRKLVSDVQTIPTMYESLSELTKEWEDYRPKEPYIGDEATAKFVRAWAKHWGIDEVRVRLLDKGLLGLWNRPTSIKEGAEEIDIQAAFVTGDVEDEGIYTIDELCGEEEE